VSEEEAKELEQLFIEQQLAYARDCHRKFVEEPRRKRKAAADKLSSFREDNQDPASETTLPREQPGKFGTPSLLRRAKQDGMVLVPTAFRQITDNGDQALLLAQLFSGSTKTMTVSNGRISSGMGESGSQRLTLNGPRRLGCQNNASSESSTDWSN